MGLKRKIFLTLSAGTAISIFAFTAITDQSKKTSASTEPNNHSELFQNNQDAAAVRDTNAEAPTKYSDAKNVDKKITGGKKFDNNTLAIDYRKDLSSMGNTELAAEIESIELLLKRNDVIAQLNNESLNEDERNDVNEAIAYLNTLRFAALDRDIEIAKDKVSTFDKDVRNNQFPSPELITEGEIELIEANENDLAMKKNREIQVKIDELHSISDEEVIAELGL